MYMIIHKNKLISGPMKWNRGIFTGTLEKVGIFMQLPRVAYEDKELPYEINSDTRICKGSIETPDFNSKIERTYGPIWNISSDKQLIINQTQEQFIYNSDTQPYLMDTIELSNGATVRIDSINELNQIKTFTIVSSGSSVQPGDVLTHQDGFEITISEHNLEYVQKEVVGTYGIKFKDVDAIKHELKAKVAENRYHKEQQGVVVTIQDISVTADTSRDGRNIFVQKYLMMADDELVNWKFPETWLTISKSELGLIIQTGATYIQSCFDWEMNKTAEIDLANTPQDLDNIDLE